MPFPSHSYELLLACTQSERDDQKIEHCAREIEDWDDLLHLAYLHGIYPLVAKALKMITTIPEPVKIALKQKNTQIAQSNMVMSAELIEISELLVENGITTVSFKGPILSQIAYGDIIQRQYVDLDILVQKEEIYRIEALLKSHGYHRLLKLTEAQEKIWIRYAHDMNMYHPTKRISIELHWSFLDDDYPMSLEMEPFWRETQHISLNGSRIQTLSNEHYLIYLSIHGSKHLWERIEWVKDIDLMVRHREIDWELFLEKIENSEFKTMIYFGLALSKLLFYTPFPQNILEKIANLRESTIFSNYVLESWISPKTIFEETKMMLRFFPGLKKKLRYLHKIILKPTFNEYWFVDLPRGMYWGYYLIRPYLLLKNYLTKP